MVIVLAHKPHEKVLSKWLDQIVDLSKHAAIHIEDPINKDGYLKVALMEYIKELQLYYGTRSVKVLKLDDFPGVRTWNSIKCYDFPSPKAGSILLESNIKEMREYLNGTS